MWCQDIVILYLSLIHIYDPSWLRLFSPTFIPATNLKWLIIAVMSSKGKDLSLIHILEVLSVAQMALQTGQNHLEANGIQVQVEKDADQLTVYHQGKVVLHVE